MNANLTSGHVIEVKNFPFSRTTWGKPVVDDDGGYSEDVLEGWKPGVEFEACAGEHYAVAYGLGEMILTIVSIHKPGRFPERVFYTRQWRDPDGKVFGSKKLRMTTTPTFIRRASGYKHEFILDAAA